MNKWRVKSLGFSVSKRIRSENIEIFKKPERTESDGIENKYLCRVSSELSWDIVDDLSTEFTVAIRVYNVVLSSRKYIFVDCRSTTCDRQRTLSIRRQNQFTNVF